LVLYVNVEQDKKLITGLTGDNCRVFLDDRCQEFELHAPEIPASVVLLMEYSRQSNVFLQELRILFQGFMGHAPAENWYGLVTSDLGNQHRRRFHEKQRGDPYGVGELTRAHGQRNQHL
jgi:hypothetical protein